MNANPSDLAMVGVPVFRATKRRRFARPREETLSDSAHQAALTKAGEYAERQDDGDENVHDEAEAGVSNLIRAKKHIRRAATGVQFSTTKVTREANHDTSKALVKSDVSVEKRIDITNRFVGGTGQVVNDDKHMFVVPLAIPVLIPNAAG